jgi:hypothetical protein
VGEAVSTAHHALSQAYHVLHREDEDLADEHCRLQLWASMLKRTTVSERAAAWARQHGFDLQMEAITQCDTDSRWALADVWELYASTEGRASALTKQVEDLAVRARQVNQREREVKKLEGLLQKREELDDITLRRELEALRTRETSLDRREADLTRDAQDTGLRDQEARLVAQERQLVERQMQELVITQNCLEDLWASQASDGQRVWSFLGQPDATLVSFGFSLIRGGDMAPEVGIVLPLLDSAGWKISQLEEAIDSHLEEEGRALAQAMADHVLMCFRTHDPSISLEPVVQGPVEGSTEAARDGVEEAARAVAERFEREPEDA